MSKTIKINPDLFSFSKKRSSRKNKSDDSVGGKSAGIKVKSPKDNNKTLRKNHVLRFIRDQQEKNYQKMLEGDLSVSEKPDIITTTQIGDFNTDFDESLKYLMTLTEDTKNKSQIASHNQTLKRYPNQNTGSLLFNPAINPTDINLATNENVSLDFPDISSPLNLAKPAIPAWGCLKGGNLPTFRRWNSTQRRMPNYNTGGTINNTGGIHPLLNASHGFSEPEPVVSPELSSLLPSPIMGISSAQTAQEPNASIMSGGLGPSINNSSAGRQAKMNEIKQMSQKVAQQKQPKKMRYPKQRRTVKRTYKVGKSKVHPKVSVLISNKTLRNNITTKAQLLKQTPIEDVKRFLTKRGFIKVGSSAPNDVLRKMHETVSLMCGEIQNHNPDNLLYNFLNEI